MEDVSKNEGRTVLFVSHNLSAIQALCTFGVVLRQGEVFFQGGIKDAIDAYTKQSAISQTDTPLTHRTDRIGDGNLRFVDFELLGAPKSGEPTIFKVAVEARDDFQDASLSIGIRNEVKELLTTLQTRQSNTPVKLRKGTNTFHCHLYDTPLSEGKYYIDLWAAALADQVSDELLDAAEMEVYAGTYFANGFRQVRQYHGSVLCNSRWSEAL